MRPTHTLPSLSLLSYRTLRHEYRQPSGIFHDLLVFLPVSSDTNHAMSYPFARRSSRDLTAVCTALFDHASHVCIIPRPCRLELPDGRLATAAETIRVRKEKWHLCGDAKAAAILLMHGVFIFYNLSATWASTWGFRVSSLLGDAGACAHAHTSCKQYNLF